MTDLHDLTAAQLLAHFASRQLSPIDYYDHLLGHIDRWEPQIRALYAFDPEQVRREAQASTERWNKGQPNGVLDGVPVTIKELVVTGHCISAPTSAARCVCPPPGAAWWGSSRPWGVSRLTLTTPGAPPGP